MKSKIWVWAVLAMVWSIPALSAQRLMWSSTENGQIWTSDLSGADPQLFVDINVESGEEGHEPRKLAYSETTKRLYWTENSLGKAGIFSVNDEGTDVQTVVDLPAVFGAGEYFTEGLTIVGDTLYWTDTARKKVYRAGLDGSGAAVLIDGTDGTLNDATGITSDGTSLYWCDRGFEGIYTAGLDGSEPRRIVDVAAATGDSFFGTWDIVYAGGKLYWTGVFGPSVYSANPDGSGVTAVLANAGSIGANRPFGITAHEGVLYFGDSEQFSTAIYKVGVGGEEPGLLVEATTDDRYPLVIPGADSSPVPQPTPAPPASIVKVGVDNDAVVIDLQLETTTFDWHGAEFVSVVEFPNPWFPEGPGLRHRLSLGTNELGVAEWLQDDFIVVGTYEIVDATRVLVTFEGFGDGTYDLMFDPATGTLTLANVEYRAHQVIPLLGIDHSLDLRNWAPEEGAELPVGNRVPWGESFSVRVPSGVNPSRMGFFRVGWDN